MPGAGFTVDYDPEADGYTQPSLKRLKNEICSRLEHKVIVHQIQTDEIRCGFLIMDHDTHDAVWSGDGFRTDECGEGGAGFKTARLFLYLMNVPISLIISRPISDEFCSADVAALLDKTIADCGCDDDYLFSGITRLIDRIPNYVRRDDSYV